MLQLIVHFFLDIKIADREGGACPIIPLVFKAAFM